jgi:hypothetical protein
MSQVDMAASPLQMVLARSILQFLGSTDPGMIFLYAPGVQKRRHCSLWIYARVSERKHTRATISCDPGVFIFDWFDISETGSISAGEGSYTDVG